MKHSFILVPLFAAFATCGAQEKIPAEKVNTISHKLVENLGEVADAQVKIAPNPDKSAGFTFDGAGVIVVPDRNLTAAALKNAGSEIFPLGNLFFKDIVPARKGKAAPAEMLRPVTITDNGQEHRVTAVLLGIRKQDDQLELVVYGKDDAPLLQLPLHKMENKDQPQELPLEVSGERQDDATGMVTLHILGQFKAMLVVKRSDG